MSESAEQQAAQVIKSHICVVLFDAVPGPNEDPLAVWARLKIFINAYVSKSRRNFAAIVLYGTEGVQVVYPPMQYEERLRKEGLAHSAKAGQQSGRQVPWASLSWPVRLRELNDQMSLFPDKFPAARRSNKGVPAGSITAAMSIGLSMINKFLSGQRAQGVRSSARMLLVHRNSPYHAREYLAMMNCIFCAEKLHVPIDACALSYVDDDNSGTARLETLTQAASITHGLYFQLGRKHHDAFLQWLFTIFFAHTERRDLVRRLIEFSVAWRGCCP